MRNLRQVVAVRYKSYQIQLSRDSCRYWGRKGQIEQLAEDVKIGHASPGLWDLSFTYRGPCQHYHMSGAVFKNQTFAYYQLGLSPRGSPDEWLQSWKSYGMNNGGINATDNLTHYLFADSNQIGTSLQHELLFNTILCCGQSKYAAGISLQNVFARHRVSLGLKAISLNLGMMPDVSILVKDQKMIHFLNEGGFRLPKTEKDFHALLEHDSDPSRVLPPDVDPQLVCGLASAATTRKRGRPQPTWMRQPLFATLRTASNENDTDDGEHPGGVTSGYHNVLADLSSALEAAKVISNALVRRLSRSLGVTEGDIDPSGAFYFYSVDSLVAVELRNWFSRDLQVDIAVFETLDNRGCDSLAEERNLMLKARLGKDRMTIDGLC